VKATYEGKSRGSESRFEPALLDPSLPPDILYAFLAGEDEGKCAGLDDEPADIRVDQQLSNKIPTKMYSIYSRANKGRPLLLGVLFIPTARRATTPRSGVPACVEGVPARNRGSAGGAWLIDWPPPCGVGVCGSSSSIAIATSSSEEGIGSGDEDMVSGS
jgi:hypothetical protein